MARTDGKMVGGWRARMEGGKEGVREGSRREKEGGESLQRREKQRKKGTGRNKPTCWET